VRAELSAKEKPARIYRAIRTAFKRDSEQWVARAVPSDGVDEFLRRVSEVVGLTAQSSEDAVIGAIQRAVGRSREYASAMAAIRDAFAISDSDLRQTTRQVVAAAGQVSGLQRQLEQSRRKYLALKADQIKPRRADPT
jgi:hypothetical protein